jgi:nucleoside-diphosphate-sugar epimerase
MMARSVLVTGASGFVGRALVAALATDDRFRVRAAYRTAPVSAPAGVEALATGEIDAPQGWNVALQGINAVVHTVARTHVMRETEADALTSYRQINVLGTLSLARAAAAAGVKRFVFLSSIKVNGEATPIGRPFTEADAPAPLDAYGISKLEAERALSVLADETGLEVVVLRPPLIYGPGIKGNLERLTRLVARGVPLPLGAIRNQRSMIGLDNLCSAIMASLSQEAAVGRTYLVADGHDISTPELIRLIGAAMGKSPSLWAVPVALLHLAGGLTGRADEVRRLTGSLQVDAGLISRELGWQPETSVEAGLRAMVAAQSKKSPSSSLR